MAIFYENQKGNVWVRADQIKSVCVDQMGAAYRVILWVTGKQSIKFGQFDTTEEATAFVKSMPERTIEL